jgi:hypothetical protein
MKKGSTVFIKHSLNDEHDMWLSSWIFLAIIVCITLRKKTWWEGRREDEINLENEKQMDDRSNEGTKN